MRARAAKDDSIGPVLFFRQPAGATVYCTGRSVPGHAGTKGRPETVNETAEIVTARGGSDDGFYGYWGKMPYGMPG